MAESLNKAIHFGSFNPDAPPAESLNDDGPVADVILELSDRDA
jgi:hypothetical protein